MHRTPTLPLQPASAMRRWKRVARSRGLVNEAVSVAVANSASFLHGAVASSGSGKAIVNPIAALSSKMGISAVGLVRPMRPSEGRATGTVTTAARLTATASNCCLSGFQTRLVASYRCRIVFQRTATSSGTSRPWLSRSPPMKNTVSVPSPPSNWSVVVDRIVSCPAAPTRARAARVLISRSVRIWNVSLPPSPHIRSGAWRSKPPEITSSPGPPKIQSSPGPPWRTSLPSPPRITSRRLIVVRLASEICFWPAKSSGTDGRTPSAAGSVGRITYWAAALLDTFSQTVTGSVASAGSEMSFRLIAAVEPASVVLEMSDFEPSLGLLCNSENVTGCELL